MKHHDAAIEALLTRLASPRLATIDLSLDRITVLLAQLGNPHDRLPAVVHVAGTNGKGSLVAYLAAIFQAAGYRVHRYISPHLVRFNERIMLAGREIDDTYLLALLQRIGKATELNPVTFFEATTALAFLAFADIPADIVLLETGLGGRLDATNMVRNPALVALTPISMDHMEYLGDTIAAIAAEKAGIIKAGIPCVVGPQVKQAADVIAQAARAVHAPLYRFGAEWEAQPEAGGFLYRSANGNLVLPHPALAGEHQIANAATAVACVERLGTFAIQPRHIAAGLGNAKWPARLQHLSFGSLAALLPEDAELWLDGGHNPAAGEVLAGWAAQQNKPVHVICGMLKNKDMLRFLRPLSAYVRSLTAVAIENEPLSQSAAQIAASATAAGIIDVHPMSNKNIKNIIESIVKREKNGFIILICGSLYLAGNILWQNNKVY